MDPKSPNIKFGPRDIYGDKAINKICDARLRNMNSNEDGIYYEHPISESKIIDVEDFVEDFHDDYECK